MGRLRFALSSRSGGTVVNERRGSIAQRNPFVLSLVMFIENLKRTKMGKKGMLVVVTFEDFPMVCFNSWLIFMEGLNENLFFIFYCLVWPKPFFNGLQVERGEISL